jgi:acetate kinase
LAFTGIEVDEYLGDDLVWSVRTVSSAGSDVAEIVIRTNEELEIALRTADALRRAR